MPWLRDFGDVLVRAVHLLALAVAPWGLSPEPSPSANLPLAAVIAAIALALILFGALRLRVAAGPRLGSAAAAAIWLAVAASFGGALVCRGDRAPLGRAVLFVAPVVWIAVAFTAAAAAGKWLAPWKGREKAAAALALTAGAIGLAASSWWLTSPEQMWWAALDRDPAHPLVAEALTGPMLRERRLDDARRTAGRCLSLYPNGCACLYMKAEVELNAGALADAIAVASSARATCPTRGPAGSILAVALAQSGDAARAEEEARLGLDQGGPEPRLRYALALALQRRGRIAEAKQELDKAIAAGAGRDAKLLLGALAILEGDLDSAQRTLAPLASESPSDAIARYDLALIADRRNDYNTAREGYLAVLRVDPRNADARYNLALLAWRHGVADEAKHHAEKFLGSFPTDPRGPELVRTITLAPPKR